MKFPFNFDNCYPLTLGVADDYSTLQTRLKRLKRAPHQPRPGATWLVSGALLVSFAAVVPLRLTARAQTEAKTPPRRYANIAGIVRDAKGKALADVTVYALQPERTGEILETVKSDAQGRFRFSDKVDSWTQLFADAGARGLGTLDVYSRSTRAVTQIIEVAPASRLKLRFIAGQNRPVAGLKVRLWRIGRTPDFNAVVSLPAARMRALQATTNARGEATFERLPQGIIAQFRIDNLDKTFDGQRFAQLVYDDNVHLDKTETTREILLMAPVAVAGRVLLPGGTGAANATVSASRIPDGQTTGITGNANDDGYFRTTVTDAAGRYRIDGLHRGAYGISAAPAPKTPGVTRFSKDVKISLGSALTRADVKMSRGGLVQGVVISQSTKQPVKGQTLILDSDGDREAVISDARGYFRFRPFAGPVKLEVHANGTNSPPPGFVLPVQSKFDFQIKDGEKREFKIELPGKRLTKPTSGIVVGPDGRGVAGASVTYRDISRGVGDLNQSLVSDANGRFALSGKSSAGIVQMFADKAGATTPYSTMAAPGASVQLQLAPAAWASIAGRVTDQSQRPLANIKVELTHFYNGRSGITNEKTYTDRNGDYRFARVRPNTSVWVRAAKTGYAEANDWNMTPLPQGQTRRVDLTVRRAPATLAGVVYGADGRPARGYSVMATGLNSAVATDKNGRFTMPQVVAGALTGWVYGPKQPAINQWPFKATGGDRNVVIRLSEVPRDRSYERVNRMFESAIKPAALIGKAAPPLRVTQWSGGRALSLDELRDKPVFLVLGAFDGNDNELRDVARSFGERLHFVGVQIKLKGVTSPIFDISSDEAARKMGFPMAVDALIAAKKPVGWQTFASYGSSQYAVIGRDGKVVYAGRELERALELALAN